VTILTQEMMMTMMKMTTRTMMKMAMMTTMRMKKPKVMLFTVNMKNC
jgi:hypothetical protein